MIQNSYDSNGYDSNGYDSNGYDSNGYDSHQSLRILRIRDSAHGASCTGTYDSAFTYDEKYTEWVPMGCGGHIG